MLVRALCLLVIVVCVGCGDQEPIKIPKQVQQADLTPSTDSSTETPGVTSLPPSSGEPFDVNTLLNSGSDTGGASGIADSLGIGNGAILGKLKDAWQKRQEAKSTSGASSGGFFSGLFGGG